VDADRAGELSSFLLWNGRAFLSSRLLWPGGKQAVGAAAVARPRPCASADQNNPDQQHSERHQQNKQGWHTILATLVFFDT
jgi:hypothetical protein